MTLSDYYAKLRQSQTGCVSSHKAPSPVTSTKLPLPAGKTMASTSSSSSWSSNPLVWTTIVSLSIAIVATVSIVSVVVCVQVRRRCRGKAATGAPGERQQSTPSRVENGTGLSSLPSTQIYVPNELKEKSGKLILHL